MCGRCLLHSCVSSTNTFENYFEILICSEIDVVSVFTETVGKADVVLKEETPTPMPHAQEVPAMLVSKAERPVSEEEKAADQELSSQEIEELEDVLEHIAEEKELDIDKSSLNALKEDVEEYNEVSLAYITKYIGSISCKI